MGPDNALMSDTGLGIELPQMQEETVDLTEEKKMAKYSRTAEFKRIQKHCDERIKFYQTYLPGGLEVGLDVRPLTEDWMVANRVIGELNLLKNMYEVAQEAVDGIQA